MYEIRFHGRGGQGAVVASKILARAAFVEGMHTSAFPFFGVERRGAPVTAYTRIDERPVRIKSGIYEPDFVIVLDPSLFKAVDPGQGLKTGGKVLMNTHKKPTEMREYFPDESIKLYTVDATAIATEHGLGSKMAPIVNTSVVGAFAKMSGLIKLDSVLKAIDQDVPIKKEKNKDAAIDAYGKVMEE